MSAKCPSCGASVGLEKDVLTGEIVECEECGEELEVKNEDGTFLLNLAPDVEEDWGE